MICVKRKFLFEGFLSRFLVGVQVEAEELETKLDWVEVGVSDEPKVANEEVEKKYLGVSCQLAYLSN